MTDSLLPGTASTLMSWRCPSLVACEEVAIRPGVRGGMGRPSDFQEGASTAYLFLSPRSFCMRAGGAGGVGRPLGSSRRGPYSADHLGRNVLCGTGGCGGNGKVPRIFRKGPIPPAPLLSLVKPLAGKNVQVEVKNRLARRRAVADHDAECIFDTKLAGDLAYGEQQMAEQRLIRGAEI